MAFLLEGDRTKAPATGNVIEKYGRYISFQVGSIPSKFLLRELTQILEKSNVFVSDRFYSLPRSINSVAYHKEKSQKK